MLRHKSIDRICCVVLALTLLLTGGFMGAAATGLISGERTIGYENRLFDQSRVHTIDIVMDDWEGFLETCTSEEYSVCTLVIDGERYSSVGIRGKGNTSLSSVQSYGNDRYSFKVEFDQYQSGKTYHGLDKLSLNNLIQDKTYMKDYLAYTLMNKMGVAAPLCSFVQINVNGEAWGLYLAVEGVEDSFLSRNYGSDSGELYKPDSMSFGGGRGNGREFDMDEFMSDFDASGVSDEGATMPEMPSMEEGQMPDMSSMTGGEKPDMMQGEADAADGIRRSGGKMGGFRFSLDEETLREVFEKLGIDQSLLDGVDFENITMETVQSVMASLDEETVQKLMQELMGSVSIGDMGGGMGGSMGAMGSSDVMLQYTDDDPDSYSNIFNNAKIDVSEADQQRLIESLKTLSEGEEIESVVDTDAVIRYLVVHNFLCNDDSYTGTMVHNYYLYEEDGVLSMIPWDYNLAFGGFSMGGMGTGSGATSTVNSPIDSPVSSGDISSRPIISWIFESEEYTARYHELYAQFVSEVFDSGWLAEEIARVSEMIAPYVEAETRAFFTYEQFQSGVTELAEFCDLRGQSIAGQLDGTIPSTSEGQRADSSALIDGSGVDLSAMGEFNQGGKGEMGGKDFGDQMPGGMTVPGMGGQQTEETQSTENAGAGFGGQMPGGMTMPGMGDRQTEETQSAENAGAGFGSQMPGGMTMPGMGGLQTGETQSAENASAGFGGQMPGGMAIPGMGGQQTGEMQSAENAGAGFGSQMPGGMTMPGMGGQQLGETQPAENAGAETVGEMTPPEAEAQPVQEDSAGEPSGQETESSDAQTETPSVPTMPSGFPGGEQVDAQQEIWLLAGSLAALLAAILIAKFYRSNR